MGWDGAVAGRGVLGGMERADNAWGPEEGTLYIDVCALLRGLLADLRFLEDLEFLAGVTLPPLTGASDCYVCVRDVTQVGECITDACVHHLRVDLWTEAPRDREVRFECGHATV